MTASSLDDLDRNLMAIIGYAPANPARPYRRYAWISGLVIVLFGAAVAAALHLNQPTGSARAVAAVPVPRADTPAAAFVAITPSEPSSSVAIPAPVAAPPAAAPSAVRPADLATVARPAIRSASPPRPRADKPARRLAARSDTRRDVRAGATPRPTAIKPAESSTHAADDDTHRRQAERDARLEALDAIRALRLR